MVYFQFAGALVVARASNFKNFSLEQTILGPLLGLSTWEEAHGKKKHEVPIPYCCTEVVEKSFSGTQFPTCFALA